MKLMTREVIAFLGLIVLISMPARAANLLSNGSFELPGFSDAVHYISSTNNEVTGWTVQGTASRKIALHKTPAVGSTLGQNFNFAQDGNYYLDLSATGTIHPTITQTFPTWQGMQYVLSFYIGSAVPGPLNPTINIQLYDERTNLNVTLTPAPSTGGDINWTYYEFVWTASANNTQLSIRDTSATDDNASFIDNVRAERWPRLPGAFHILSVAYTSGILFPPPVTPAGWAVTWESSPSYTYQVEYKNSQSDSSWTPLGAPILADWHPTTTFVDTTTNGTPRFYRISAY